MSVQIKTHPLSFSSVFYHLWLGKQMLNVEAEFLFRPHVWCCNGRTAKSPQVQLTWNHMEAKHPHYQSVKIFGSLGYYSACILYRHTYYLCIFFLYNRVTNNALQGKTGVSSCSEISGTELPGNYLLLTKHAKEILSVHGVWAMLWFSQIELTKGFCPVCTLSSSDEERLSQSLWVLKSQ